MLRNELNVMDLVFACPPYHRGGVTRWMVDMALESVKAGVKVYLITVIPKQPFHSAGAETVASLIDPAWGIEVISAPVNWQFELGTDDYRASIYTRLLDSSVPESATVILSNDTCAWLMARHRSNKYNFIGVLHADEQHYYDLARIFGAHISLFVCVSNRIANKLKEDGTGGVPVATIPCGIPLSNVEHDVNHPGNFKILFIGRITQYQKRVFDIPLIIEKLIERNIDFKLEIIGDGQDLATLKQQVTSKKMQNHISFTGWLSKPQVLQHLVAADALLLTSDFEGMPVAAMEALNAGCAVVSTRVSGIEDYEDHPLAMNTLFLYETGAVEEAATCLLKAAATDHRARAQAARALAAQEFGIRRCFEMYCSAFKDMRLVALKTAKPISIGKTIYSYTLSLHRHLRMQYLTNRRTKS